MGRSHIRLAVLLESHILSEQITVATDDSFSIGIPYYQLLIRLFQVIILIQIHLLSGTSAGFAIGKFAYTAYLPEGIGRIVAIHHIELIATLVGVHQLAAPGKFRLDQLGRNRIDNLLHNSIGSVLTMANILFYFKNAPFLAGQRIRIRNGRPPDHAMAYPFILPFQA